MTISATTLRPYFTQYGYPTSNEQDKELQRLLKAAGFDPGPIDGVRGEKTLAAAMQALASPSVSPSLASALEAAGARALSVGNKAQPTLADFFQKDKTITAEERKRIAGLFGNDQASQPKTAAQEQLSAEVESIRAATFMARPNVRLNDKGHLSVIGTRNADKIDVSRAGGMVDVNITDAAGRKLLERSFPEAKVKGVTIAGGAGDDDISNRNVDNARILPGTGNNRVYNSGEKARILGSQRHTEGTGDMVFNQGDGTKIKGSNGADLVVNTADGATIDATTRGDLTVLTGRDSKANAGAEGQILSNGYNDLRAKPKNVTSDLDLAGQITNAVREGMQAGRDRPGI